MKSLTLIAVLLLFTYIVPVTAQQPALDIERIQRATVFVMQVRNVEDNLFITCVSSGTLVSRDGLILTNAHSTQQSADCPGTELIIALNVRSGESPIAQYRAEIAQIDPGLDLALLRITREPDGRLVNRENLALPFVELADSSATRIDETITIVGYPGIADDPVTAVQGTITGFALEPRSTNSASWIKTSAVISGTMSGGGAYNTQGQLVGIPTTAPLRQGILNTNCIPIQDTNRDGIVTASDDCIAIGGFINALRPSNLARPLVRAASLGLDVEVMSLPTTTSSGNTPTISRLFFSPSVNEAGMPTTVISNLPSGSTSLYLFFDYANMSPETVYELRVTTDGRPNATFSLAPVRWSGGSSGLWYIGSSGQPWPNGVYEFTLFANGVAAPTQRLTIGGPPQITATMSDIVFGLLNLRGEPLGNGFVLPSGNTASAQFLYRNMSNGTNWTAIWYLDGNEVSRTPDVWSEGETGSASTSIQDPNGLRPGSYRLELYVENGLAATSDFTLAGAQQGVRPQIFSNARFTTAATPAEAAQSGAISTFSDSIPQLYALFDWQQIAPGTLWTLRWLVDGDVFYEQVSPWTMPESGQNFTAILSSPNRLPDGTYNVQMLVNNLLLASIEAKVGIGQLPIDRFARADGVLLRGQILDSNTRQGIPGVAFILISEDFSVSDFDWNQSKVYALAVTDQNGFFELERPLEYSTDDREIAYSAVIAADGYQPISADGIEVTTETENPLELIIYLSRD
ncbi:MAG: trypsin-like peptidase domain-containing protein [Anaerolineae bacterium]|nr:trypsin-like peptidase domain-containing protein [Anaerolineae bacterium]